MTQAQTSSAELSVFLGLTFAASAPVYVSAASGGGLVPLLMWVPGLSALATRLLFHRTLRGFGWPLPSLRNALLALFAPIFYSSIAYGWAWLGGMAGLDVSRFREDAVPFVIVGLLQSLFLALGEELGWRGFLVPALSQRLSFRGTATVSGVIWAIWHVPLIVFAGYNAGTPTWYGMFWFVVMALAMSFPLAWSRLHTGSLWPAVLLHASHNLFVQGWFDQVTVDTGPTRWLVGEFGAAFALIVASCAWLFTRVAAPLRAELQP